MRAIGYFLLFLTRVNLILPVVMLFEKVLINHAQKKIQNKKIYTILALSPYRFRGDLEILENTGEFKILRLPFKWQARIFSIFYGKTFKCSSQEFFNMRKKSGPHRNKVRYRRFLFSFLKVLYARNSIDCVIGAAIHYKHDVDWGAMSDKINVPYIVLHRENLMASKVMLDYFLAYAKRLTGFEGRHIIVQNEIARQALIDVEYVESANVSALGCLRMDGFINKIRSLKYTNSNRIVLFSFLPGLAMFVEHEKSYDHWPSNRNDGWYNFYENVHLAVSEIAVENPDVDVVIKTKWGGEWPASIFKLLAESGIQYDEHKNLHIVSEGDAQELILNSQVVSGFGTTTLLEAAIANRHVVMPIFDEPAMPKFKDAIFFKDKLELFDVTKSKEEYKVMLLNKLHGSRVSKELSAERASYFEYLVSSITADATPKYASKIIHCIETRV